MATRKAGAVWEGGLKSGRGTVQTESGALNAQYGFSSRFENGPGSNPEELLAAAEAGCFSMALAGALERNGTPPQRVDTNAACTVEKVGDGFRITRIALEVRVRATGVDAATFQRIAEETKVGCPVSGAFKGNVELQLDARLEG